METEFRLLGEDVEREIIMTQQALTLKTTQLEETRRKLHMEVVENEELKNCLEKNVKEIENYKMELDLYVNANAKLEEENAKCRETTATFQAQNELYMAERELLMERCHSAEVEMSMLRIQVVELKDKLQEQEMLTEQSEQFKAETKDLIDQVLSKQETLNEEQTRLKKAVEEGTLFSSKLSEELNLQFLFLKETNISRVKLEDETVRLIGILEQERNEKRKLLQSMPEVEREQSYLNDWKTFQEEAKNRICYFIDENKKLLNEIESLRVERNLLLKKDSVPAV